MCGCFLFVKTITPVFESLHLNENDHLTEIEALPSRVNLIRLGHCDILKKIRVPYDLVNLESLIIMWCPELEELPSLAHSTSLRGFVVSNGCCRIQKIEGLENCARLERLETSLEVPGLQSLEHMKKLRSVNLKASK